MFSESASRAVVSTSEQQADALLKMAAEAGVPARVIGRTGGPRIRISVEGEAAIDCDVREAERRWSGALAGFFQRQAS